MADYELIKKQMLALSEDSGHFIPLMSNVSALLFSQLTEIN